MCVRIGSIYRLYDIRFTLAGTHTVKRRFLVAGLVLGALLAVVAVAGTALTISNRAKALETELNARLPKEGIGTVSGHVVVSLRWPLVGIVAGTLIAAICAVTLVRDARQRGASNGNLSAGGPRDEREPSDGSDAAPPGEGEGGDSE
ncbi:MAG: hypothetical protein ACYTFI_18180 [Planctomycetota bacterium]